LGAKQQAAFDQIKHYLSTLPVLREPKSGEPFWLYIAVQEDVIGVVLTQEFEAKEHIITYVSRRLLEAQTRGHLVIMCKARIFMWKQNQCSEARKLCSIQSLVV
jgi:hypothetical protein